LKELQDLLYVSRTGKMSHNEYVFKNELLLFTFIVNEKNLHV